MFLFCCKGILSRRSPPGRKPSLWEFTFTQTNPSLHLGDVGFSLGSYPQFFCHIRRREGGSGGSFCPSGSGLLAKHLSLSITATKQGLFLTTFSQLKQKKPDVKPQSGKLGMMAPHIKQKVGR